MLNNYLKHLKSIKYFTGVFIITGSALIAKNSIAINSDIVINKTAHYKVRADGTYTLNTILKQKVNTASAANKAQKSPYTYFPKQQTVEVVSAYAILPSGKKINVNKDSIFTRPSQASADSPGFTNSLTKTVVYPQLSPGSTTYIEWKITQLKPNPFGFHALISPNFSLPTKNTEMTIEVPHSIELHWAKKGDFNVKTISKKTKDGTIDHITAKLINSPSHITQTHMVSTNDLSPYFMVSTLPSWKAWGDIWWKFYEPKLKVTPKVQKLANKILKNLPENINNRDKKAAALLYQWVATNIHYVAIYTIQSSDYTPNSPDVILEHGYGDCKDFSTLLIVLLKAANINAYPVAIDWSSQFNQYPLPNPASFNHAIVYIPKWKIFLNPTNSMAPFNTLDTYLAGKFALIIKPNSEVRFTPKNHAKNNHLDYRSTLTLLKSGELKGHEINVYTGTMSEMPRGELSIMGARVLAQKQLQNSNLIGFGNIKSSPTDNLIQPFIVKANWNAPNGIYMDNEVDLFLSPPYGLSFFHLDQLNSFVNYGRLWPMIVGAKSFHWEQEIKYPESYRLKYLPKDINIANPAGLFKVHWKKSGDNKITIIKDFVIKHDIYSAKQYPKLQKILLAAMQSKQQMIVLTKN